MNNVETIATSTFTANGTTYVASQGNGSIVVSKDDPSVTGRRRKRALAVELGEAEEQEVETEEEVRKVVRQDSVTLAFRLSSAFSSS